jgi:hypothetical protein
MTETAPPARGRGRPPGSKNKAKPGRITRENAKSARVEARKRAATQKAPAPPRPAPAPARPKPPMLPPIVDVQAEIVLPGEGFGQRQSELPDIYGDGKDAQSEFVWPRPRGRPEGTTLLKADEVVLDRIWRVGWEQGTQASLAVALGVSLKTLQRFFDANEIARDTFRDAAAAGRGSLSTQAYRQAMEGNTPVLIHTLRHWGGMGGMNDRVPVLPFAESEGGDQSNKPQRIVIEFVDAKNPAS